VFILEVSLNGRRLCSAGIADGVYDAYVYVTEGVRMPNGQLLPPSLRVSGLKDFTNLTWADVEALAPGDEVLIRVLEDGVPDEPRTKPRPDADAEEAQERLNYERLKRKYESR
jgi:hypothetical protein